MDISNARHIVIYIASQMTGLTLKQIGDKINRNHSTISASLNKMEKDLKKNSRLKANIEDIMEKPQKQVISILQAALGQAVLFNI